MRSWLPAVRRVHLYLGVFFAPLLLFFLLTGCWQTFAPSDDQAAAKNWFASFMDPLTSVHTEDFYPPEKAGRAHLGFKLLVGGMAIGMACSTLMGLYLAFRLSKQSWPVILALSLGLIVPVILLVLDW
jgi:MFS family permease